MTISVTAPTFLTLISGGGQDNMVNMGFVCGRDLGDMVYGALLTTTSRLQFLAPHTITYVHASVRSEDMYVLGVRNVFRQYL